MKNSELIKKYKEFKKSRAEQLLIAKELYDKCDVVINDKEIDKYFKKHIKEEAIRSSKKDIPAFKNVYKTNKELNERREKILKKLNSPYRKKQFRNNWINCEYYYYFKESARDRIFVEVKNPIGINPRWKQIKEDTGLSSENYSELANLKILGIENPSISFLNKVLSIVEGRTEVHGLLNKRRNK